MVGNDDPQSAWKCKDTCAYRKGECYLHNFLDEMPDLNLKNDKVIDELKVIIFISYILTVMICVYNVIQSI